jgi:hypothetical protein
VAQYVKSTNFAVKDGLAQGDPGKIVKGTEIDTEFNAIASAIGTKADTNSPTFTGVPLAPTATGTTNNTQIATTAFVQSAITAAVTATLSAAYPVGSIYTNATSSTNPATLLGFGTWSAFGAGRMMVGFNGSDPLFDSAEETGGSKDAIVVSHTHTGTTASNGAHTHTFPLGDNNNDNSAPAAASNGSVVNPTGTTNSNGAHTHTFTTDSTGSSGTNANLPPYITVYLWKRIA